MTSFHLFSFLVESLFAVLTLNVYLTGATSSVNVALQASFSSPPYLLELLETAAEENATSYFPLLDRIADGRFSECGSDQELHTEFAKVLVEDGHITTDDDLSSFHFALAIHSAAPRIEAHYQYYDTTIEPSLMVAQDAACPVWVHFDGKQYCSPQLDRAQQEIGDLKNSAGLPFDRVLGSSHPSSVPHSVLYADISSPLFPQFHKTISETARNGETTYRIRYRPQDRVLRKSLPVNGYGVELALKRTDYIVIDDRQADSDGEDGESDPEASSMEIETDNSNVLDSMDEDISDLKPLTAKELAGLGLKTTSFVMGDKDPLDTLLRISLDFPKFSQALSKRNVSRELVSEHRRNRQNFLPAGYNVIWMNGQQVQAREMDAFALLQQMRRERFIVGNLRSLGFSGLEAVRILSHPAIAETKSESKSQRYDYRDSLDGGRVIIWLNDIEKDKRYDSWPETLSSLLQPTWPGQLPQVRRDIHNVVIPMDLSDPKDIEIVVEQLQMVVKRKVAIRFGIVPLLASQAASDQAKAVYYLWDAYGLSSVLMYLESCMKSKGLASANKLHFDSAKAERNLRQGQEDLELQHVLQSDSVAENVATEAAEVSKSQSRSLDQTQQWLKRLGADKMPSPFFTNGVAMARNDNWLSTTSSRIDVDLRWLQRQIYESSIPEDTSLAELLLGNAPTQRNALIVPEDPSSISISDLGHVLGRHPEALQTLPRLEPSLDSGFERLLPQLLLVADLDSTAGRDLLSEAVKFQVANHGVEVLLIHNADTKDPPSNAPTLSIPLSRASVVWTATELEHLLEDNAGSGPVAPEEYAQASRFWQAGQKLLQDLHVEPGQQALFLNGRKVGPITPSSPFLQSDFELLLQYERSERFEAAERVLSALGLHDRITSAVQAAVLTSTVALSTISDIPEGIFDSSPTLRMNKFEEWESNHTMIETGEASSASIHLVASIDPTSPMAQRWISILKVLSELSGVHMKLFLNPKEKIQELPIKRFYRHVLDARPTFTSEGEVRSLAAEFHGVPKEALLNLALDVPPAWVVAAKESVHDLDNIKLSALTDGSNVEALYELEYILIEGHSRDLTVGSPPRGVQLVLGTEKDPYFADTIIMANLGYFQFKVNPGYWSLNLRAGRSSQIYNIDSAGSEGWYPAAGDETTDMTLMSFQGKTLYPRLSRKPGQEEEDVLEEGSSFLNAGTPGSYMHKASKLASSLLSKAGVKSSGSQHADINIFSVASGHLYERMLSIMMVSVMRHTKQSVKFWFIEQFLSPSFKASLPTLAAHYKFSYELVTYKWPHWLRAQTEKQRVIWGYKILFLDVLFPTSLEKVIFVDADQIVRTDMSELIKLDLEGAPYGFTPMCDSRTEMEGFRFWKTGYWSKFLQGLPYHISALYVVDLVKFREIAAGDRLRGQYHQLSADPGSLSNLDQDLPNHMQHVLKIKSLPQDWLWCETWCSDEALKTAKTIDLCNNPQTKEPKLKRARRQVPEWTIYDDEIAEVLKVAEGDGGEVRGGVQEVMVEGSVSAEAKGSSSTATTTTATAAHTESTHEETRKEDGDIRDEL